VKKFLPSHSYNSHEWISSSAFANVVGISERKSRQAFSRCYSGNLWRGHNLIVRKVKGKGGKSGWQYQVRLDSIPEELQLQYSPPLAVETVPQAVETKDIDWRYTVIQRALKHPLKSRERGLAVKKIAATYQAKPDGSRIKISERTIREWIKRYETAGPQGLGSRKRADKGAHRVTISRRWDRGVDLPESFKNEISAKLEKYICSLWRSLQPDSGWYEVQRHASTFLLRLTLETAPDTPPQKFKKLCIVPRSLVERFREFKAVAIHDMDAKEYFDRITPRIQRSTAKLLPMECVMGDVHPIDIYYYRTDGSVATPKGIFWMDAATERLWCLPVFFKKGFGVCQEHVIESFGGMAEDPTWGVPGGLYLDNGGEYNWSRLIKDALALSVPIYFAEDGKYTPTAKDPITKAQPYNSAAKGMIEGVFGALERKYFTKIPGWIGGDRTRKKITNVGKPPEPFPHSQEDLFNFILQAVDLYNDTPRGGRLGGLSPNEKYRQFVDNGWQSSFFEEGILEGVLCKTEIRTVRQGRIRHLNEWYYHNALTNPAIGERVEIRVPLFGNKNRLMIFDHRGDFVCLASPDEIFDHDDRAGAVESTRRKRLARHHIRTMKSQTDKLDTLKLLTEEVEQIGPLPVPEPGGIISLSDDTEKAGKQLLMSPAKLRKRESTEHDKKMREWSETMDKIKKNKRANG
jgi:hypothetical protein